MLSCTSLSDYLGSVHTVRYRRCTRFENSPFDGTQDIALPTGNSLVFKTKCALLPNYLAQPPDFIDKLYLVKVTFFVNTIVGV
jgi:hypothetical protein